MNDASFILMHNAGKALCVANARAAPRRTNPRWFPRGKPSPLTMVVFAHSRVRLYGALNASGKSLIEFSPGRSSLFVLFAFLAIKVGNAVNILSIRGSRNWGDNEDNSVNESREFHTL